MTFDLIVFPVDRALTYDEAVVEVGRRDAVTLPFGIGHDKRLDPFIAGMERRLPGIRRGGPSIPCEFDVLRRQVHIGVTWSAVEDLVQVVGEVAWRTGVAVFDPQRGTVSLPAPFADGPMTAEGTEAHIAAAEGALAAIATGAALVGSDDEPDASVAIPERLTAAGYTLTSPLGFEITPELRDEVMADPTRMPTSLQTAERKRELIASLEASKVGDRHIALGQLAGWDPDPDVATALRPMLWSDDVFEAGQAASGLARQRDITDLPGVLDLVYRLSPADGGNTEAMLVPLRAALDLAALANPDTVEGVKSRARQWRGSKRARRQSWEHEFDAELDELLGP